MQQILFNAYSAGNLVNRQSIIQAGEESTRNIKSYKAQKKLIFWEAMSGSIDNPVVIGSEDEEEDGIEQKEEYRLG